MEKQDPQKKQNMDQEINYIEISSSDQESQDNMHKNIQQTMDPQQEQKLKLLESILLKAQETYNTKNYQETQKLCAEYVQIVQTIKKIQSLNFLNNFNCMILTIKLYFEKNQIQKAFNTLQYLKSTYVFYRYFQIETFVQSYTSLIALISKNYLMIFHKNDRKLPLVQKFTKILVEHVNILENTNKTDNQEYIQGLYVLAKTFEGSELFKGQTLQYGQRCLIQCQRVGKEESPYYSKTIHILGGFYFENDNFKKALKYYQMELNILQKNSPSSKVQYMHLYIYVGRCFFDSNNIKQSLKYYQQYLEICRANDQITQFYASLLSEMGELHAKKRHYKKAFKCFRDSLAAFEKMSGKLTKQYCDTLYTYGETMFRMPNLNIQLNLEILQQCKNIFQLIGKKTKKGDYVRTLHFIGTLHTIQKDFTEAMRYFYQGSYFADTNKLVDKEEITEQQLEMIKEDLEQALKAWKKHIPPLQ